MGNHFRKMRNYMTNNVFEKKLIQPQLHRSVNGLPSGICIFCNNTFPANRECQKCNECTISFGCKCGNLPEKNDTFYYQ